MERSSNVTSPKETGRNKTKSSIPIDPTQSEAPQQPQSGSTKETPPKEDKKVEVQEGLKGDEDGSRVTGLLIFEGVCLTVFVASLLWLKKRSHEHQVTLQRRLIRMNGS